MRWSIALSLTILLSACGAGSVPRIESSVPLLPDLLVTLHIEVPDWDAPLIIEAARVQWVSGPVFGLAFFAMRPAERQRLDQVIAHLMDPRAAA